MSSRTIEGPIVCDTGPLIALCLIDQLEILPRLYSRIIVPDAVLQEVQTGGWGRPGTGAILSADWIERGQPVAAEPLLGAELGPGEAAGIATAFQVDARMVVLDERRARRIALRAYGLRVKGSAGILVAAKRAGLVEAVRPLLESMAAQGYFLSQRVVDRAALEAGEPSSEA